MLSTHVKKKPHAPCKVCSAGWALGSWEAVNELLQNFLAEGVIPARREHLAGVRLAHEEDLRAGFGGVVPKRPRGRARLTAIKLSSS